MFSSVRIAVQMLLFIWLLPHVTLQDHHEHTVVFSVTAETKEDALQKVAAHLDVAHPWSWEASRRIQEWLARTVPIIHDVAKGVVISGAGIHMTKVTRRRIRAIKAMETLSPAVCTAADAVGIG